MSTCHPSSPNQPSRLLCHKNQICFCGFVKHSWPLVNLCWLFPIMCFISLVVAPRRIHSMTLPETEIRLKSLYIFLYTPLVGGVATISLPVLWDIPWSPQFLKDYEEACNNISWHSSHPRVGDVRAHWFVVPSSCNSSVTALPSVMVSLCLHQPGVLLPRPGA